LSSEKANALVIRLADFSESSRVVTLFTREFGKISALAKGAKRLKSAFESGLDLLSECRVVFLHRSSTSLDLLTESQLQRRFQPADGSLNHLYGGYYVAELLNGFTEEADPHPELYTSATDVLRELSSSESPLLPILKFELSILHEIGQLPDFDSCTNCQSPIEIGSGGRVQVFRDSLLCSDCSQPNYEGQQIQLGSVAIVRRIVQSNHDTLKRINMNKEQQQEIRRLVSAAISHALGRRPKTLGMLNFR